MKTLLISLSAFMLLGCDPVKRHQRLIRKHPRLLETISTPKTDTIRIDNTKHIECPDGTVITVNCDTLVIYETNTITLPPTNAQKRQQERTKRKFEDNVRRMYQDSLKHAKRIYKLESKRLEDENDAYKHLSGNEVKAAKINAKAAKREHGWVSKAFSLVWILFFVGVFIFIISKAKK